MKSYVIKHIQKGSLCFAKLALLSGLLVAQNALAYTITSGNDWLTTDIAPSGSAWTTVGFDDSAWRNAISPYSGVDPTIGVADMWDWPPSYGTPITPGSGPLQAWFRYSFNLSDPVQSATAILAVDDNFEFYLNGQTVYLDYGTGASVEGPFDISGFLQTGANVFAIHAWDGGGTSVFNRGGEAVAFLADITAVPLPAAFWLMLPGIVGILAWRRKNT